MEDVRLPVRGSFLRHQILAEEERGYIPAAAEKESIAQLKIFRGAGGFAGAGDDERNRAGIRDGFDIGGSDKLTVSIETAK